MYHKLILFALIIIVISPISAFSDSSLLHNVGKVQMLISDWGAFTMVDSDNNVSPNFVYSGKAYLDPFSDIWVGNSSGNVASAYDGFEEGITVGEWIAVETSGVVSYDTDNPNSNQVIHTQYVPDRFNDFPYNISVDQYSYAWNSSNSSDDDYIIIKLILTNKGLSEIKDFYIAIQTNWDVDYSDWEDDLIDWDAQRQAGIAYDSDESDKTFLALTLINGKLASHNIVDANTWSFFDSDRSKLMANKDIDDINTIGKSPANYLNVISAGPYNIPAGQSVVVIYAFVAGQGIDELRANIDSATNKVITPEKLTAKPNEQTVNLGWSKCISPDIVAYKVYRSKTSGGNYSEIAEVSSVENSYNDTSVDKDSLSYYVVTAIIADGKESRYSNEVASAPGTVPDKPSNLNVKIGDLGKPILYWDAVNNIGVTGYKVFRNSTGIEPLTAIATIDKNSTSFIDDNIYSEGKYYYAIASINAYNWISEYSNIVSITIEPSKINPQDNLKNVKIVPQPCRISSDVKFINLTAMATIRIYTLNGELVKTIYHTNNRGEEKFELQNDAGISFASGVYIYQIEAYKPDQADKFIATGKIAIIK